MSVLGQLDPEDLLNIASRMAQELQDICDDAVKSGSELPATQALVNEYENDFFSKTNLSWQSNLNSESDEENILLSSL